MSQRLGMIARNRAIKAMIQARPEEFANRLKKERVAVGLSGVPARPIELRDAMKRIRELEAELADVRQNGSFS